MNTTLTPYAVEVDENTAQVISCPHCVSSSVGMKPPVSLVRTEGTLLAEILAIPLYCNECGTEWRIELVAHLGENPKPLDLVMQIVNAA